MDHIYGHLRLFIKNLGRERMYTATRNEPYKVNFDETANSMVAVVENGGTYRISGGAIDRFLSSTRQKLVNLIPVNSQVTEPVAFKFLTPILAKFATHGPCECFVPFQTRGAHVK
jgi:hypothetical protein